MVLSSFSTLPKYKLHRFLLENQAKPEYRIQHLLAQFEIRVHAGDGVQQMRLFLWSREYII